MDLTTALANIRTDADPAFQPTGGGWTDAQQREYLDNAGVKYRTVQKSGRTQHEPIGGCWICGQTEGNPAAWIVDGYPVYKCLRANKCNATWRDLQAKFSQSKLPCINALDLPGRYPHARQSVINSVLRRGDVAGIVGGPKARKSFLLEQMALSVAAGVPFLGWDTVQGRVLLVDNELRGDDLSRRLTTMAHAMGLTWRDVAKHVDIILLRGVLADIHAVNAELGREPGRYSLTLLDAWYKMLPKGTDENSNSDMTSALVVLDGAAERHDCAIAYAHHLSKGAQHQKSVTDLGSGAGAQSRSVDVHLTMTPHEDADTVILQGVLRSQKPFEPICLVFAYPLWHVATDKDPNDVAILGKKPVPTLEAFIATIPTDPAPQKPTLDNSRRVLCTSVRTCLVLLGEAVKKGLVEVVQPSNRKLPYTVKRIKKDE